MGKCFGCKEELQSDVSELHGTHIDTGKKETIQICQTCFEGMHVQIVDGLKLQGYIDPGQDVAAEIL